MPKYAIAPPTADSTGTVEAFPMYAGVSAGAVDRVEPAGEVVERLVSGADRLLRSWTSGSQDVTAR